MNGLDSKEEYNYVALQSRLITVVDIIVTQEQIF